MKSVRSFLLGVERQLTRRHKEATIVLVDALLVPLTFFLTTLLVYGSVWPHLHLARLAMLFPALAMLGALASLAAGLPRIKLKTYASLAANGIGTYAAMVGLATLLLTFLPGMHFPVVGTITFSMALFLAAILARVSMLRVLLWVLATDGMQIRVLIYGAGKTGQQLASALQAHESILVVAFVDDDPGLQSKRLMGKRIFAAQQIERLMHQFDISRVLLAMPSLSAPKQAQISRKLQAMGLGVQALPSFAQLIGTEQLVETLTTVPPGRFLGRSHLDDVLATSTTSFADKAVLISGAGGSVGSELCRQLVVQRPRKLVLYEVSELALYNIDRDLRDLLSAMADKGETEIFPVLGSVTDARLTRAVLAQHQIDTVFHAAAYKHVPLVEQNPVAGIANNVFGTRTLADACVELGVDRFILVSTDKAVRPSNIMGASKRLAELVVQDRAKRSQSTHFGIVRFGNVLGSSGSVIPLFREQIARGGPVTLTHEDVTRYFMTIAEASKLVLMAGSLLEMAEDARPHADVFVLDMGKPVRIRQLAEQMIQGAGYTVRSDANPDGDIEIEVIGLRPGEKLHEELLIGQGLLTTPHPKILRAAEESLAELEMANALRELGGHMATGDADAMRALTMRLVQTRHEQAPTAALAT
jgi:FlaA1/EpsC-like NDP-sugar epimerase